MKRVDVIAVGLERHAKLEVKSRQGGVWAGVRRIEIPFKEEVEYEKEQLRC